MSLLKSNYKSYFKPGCKIPRRTTFRVRKRLGADPSQNEGDGLYNLPKLRIKQLNDQSSDSLDDGNGMNDFKPDQTATNDKELPLFNGSQVTKSEQVILLFGIMMKHQLTHEAMNDTMKILSRIIPCATDFPKTFLQLLRAIPADSKSSSIHYYCPTCEANLESTHPFSNCRVCKAQSTKSELDSTSSFYVMFDLKASLSSILGDSKVASELFTALNARSSDTEFLKDICDGDAYKELNLDQFDITCKMNTDGVALFKSSKLSLWPILLSVNELTYKTRCSNTFVGGLWVGQKKPNFDAFFETFSNQCCELSLSGVSWTCSDKIINSKVFFPIMVCDSVARCLCQGIHQFNGSYGCTWCLNQGKSLSYGKTSRKWIYQGVDFVPRDHFQFLDHLKELCTKLDSTKSNDVSHFGITTASQLLSLPKFDIVNGFTYDYMHSAFLGISKSMSSWWTNSGRPFYIGRKLKEIDQKLLSFCVPFCFDRAIRSITLSKFWKASEWRTWTFVAVTVLKNILPSEYLQHFGYFAEATMLLSSSAIHRSEIEKCDDLVKRFVQGIPILYGHEFSLYNFHIVLHAPTCVKNWGPLWCYSAFQYESHNGKLGRLLNGHRKVDIELANKCDLFQSIVNRYRNVEKTPNIELGLSLLLKTKRWHYSREVGCVRYFGPHRLYYFTKAEQAMINRHADITCKRAFSFKKCSVKGILHTTANDKSTKRRNCIVESENSFYEITNIFEAEGNAFAFGRRLRVRLNVQQSFAFTVTGISPATTVLLLRSFVSKFICSKVIPQRGASTLKFIVKLPNTLENE